MLLFFSGYGLNPVITVNSLCYSETQCNNFKNFNDCRRVLLPWQYVSFSLFFWQEILFHAKPHKGSYRYLLSEAYTRKFRANMTPPVQTRQHELAQWVQTYLVPDNPDFSGTVQLLPVGGDAGFRSYYRIQTPHGSLLAVDAPPATEDSKAFVDVARRLKRVEIKVPDVKLVDFDRGFMLIEDFGNTHLLDLLNEQVVDTAYKNALTLLHTIQETPAEGLPLYDPSLLQTELSLFTDWFLSQLIGIDLTDEDRKLFSGMNQLLIASALEQPTCFVHRDYHSRNLMMMPGLDIGVIDFQGALQGPVLYDVVSLLKDCYICWPREQVENWLRNFAREHDLLRSVQWSTCLRWFDWMGLQRHLKCLGIFTRLWLRDGKSQYLSDIPVTFFYVLEACERYPAFAEHAQWLRKRVLPVLEQRIEQIQLLQETPDELQQVN